MKKRTYSIDIVVENEAFIEDEGAEVSRILKVLCAKIEMNGLGYFVLRDSNGNTVGDAGLIGGEE